MLFCQLPHHVVNERTRREHFRPLSGSPAAAVGPFIDSLSLFGLGASWGGYESLVTAANMQRARSVTDRSAAARWCDCTSGWRISWS